MAEELITVVGSSYCRSIEILVERLLKAPPGKVVAGRVGEPENGYALSIVLLLVVMLESFIGRVSDLQFRQKKNGRPKGHRESVPDYLASLRKSFGLRKSLTEVFVLRDAIAHGHVWTLSVSRHKAKGRILRRATLGAGYGDSKYRVALNARTRRTSILGLNLVPEAVGRREVAKVFDVVWRTLDYLARHKLLERSAFNYRGRYDGRPFDFWELRSVLRDAL